MERKSIRLSATSYALLALLDQMGEGTSYEIKQMLERSIMNFWPVPHTTAYEEPARLVEGGYLRARQEPGGRRRRVYALTKSGREALRAWAAEASAAPPQLRDEALLKVFAGSDPRPLLESRADWHREKIGELEGCLAEAREADGWEGAERSLIAGLAYHHKMLELFDDLRERR